MKKRNSSNRCGSVRSWTDKDLRATCAKVKSYIQINKSLGIRGNSSVTIKRHIKRLGIDVSHFTGIRGSNRSWTDEDLRAACVKAHSYVQVNRLLGLSDNYYTVKKYMKRLGINIPNFIDGRCQRRTWTDNQLVAACAESEAYIQVNKLLGLGGSSTKDIKKHIKRLGIDVSHFTSISGARRAWTDEDLRVACVKAHSYHGVGIVMGLKFGGNPITIKKYIKILDIDVSHFIGKKSYRTALEPDLEVAKHGH